MIFKLIILFILTIRSSLASVEITSDSLSLDNNNDSANFKGSVTVFFDDIIIKTSNLKVYYAKNGKKSITKIEIPTKLKAIRHCEELKLRSNPEKAGSTRHLTARHDDCYEVVIADSGEYEVSSNRLILTGNVVISKDENIVITDKMIYVTKFKLISKEDNEK